MQPDALAVAVDELRQAAMTGNFAQRVVDRLPPSFTTRVLRHGNDHQLLAERREAEPHQVGDFQELASLTIEFSGRRRPTAGLTC